MSYSGTHTRDGTGPQGITDALMRRGWQRWGRGLRCPQGRLVSGGESAWLRGGSCAVVAVTMTTSAGVGGGSVALMTPLNSGIRWSFRQQ